MTSITFVEAAESEFPSLTVKSIFLGVDGLSLSERNLTDRSAAWKSAFDAGPVSVRTPVPLL